MAHSQFSLTWGEHLKNICSGLSALQQHGEFVDMTLAADGHYVKVHQVILALASPYIKELISSAPCPHPVLFLNKISYETLCALLEYIYTGEVYIAYGNLAELKEAAKELHIKGLEDMKLPNTVSTVEQTTEVTVTQDIQEDDYSNMETLEDEICYFEISKTRVDEKSDCIMPDNHTTDGRTCDSRSMSESVDETLNVPIKGEERDEVAKHIIFDNTNNVSSDNPNVTVMQYTVSNQGSLQMILNRFVYYLKHTNRDNSQQWRCVDYLSPVKCPAHVITKNGLVLLRVSAHTHSFHDKKILKKVHDGVVFSAIQEAERQGETIKNSRGQADADDNE